MDAQVIRWLQSGVLLTVAGSMLTACGISDCAPHTAQAQSAQKAGNLPRAEAEYRTAIASGEKAHLPETAYIAAIHGLGSVLLAEKKYGASVPFLVRTCQLATATGMSDDDYIALLQDVVFALEKSGEYKEAAETEAVLMTFLSVEKSPADPIFISETTNQKRLDQQLASYSKQRVASNAAEMQQ